MEFKNMLEKYMCDDINAESLYNYVRNLFSELIRKYDFRKLSYLKMYPFISGLQDEDLYKDPILKEEINTILSVLEGRCDYSYDLWMNVPNQELTNIKRIWKFYKKNKKITLEQIELLEKELENINPNTIGEVCMVKLLTLLLGLPTADDNLYTYNLLYSNEVDEIIVNEDIEKMISILNGKRPVHLLLKYVSAECIFIII